MHFRWSLSVVFLSLTFPGVAQTLLWGRISKEGSTELLMGVNITNFTRQKTNVSDMGGNYRIAVHPGDRIIFSSAGYLPDTLIVPPEAGTESYPVQLTPHRMALPAVRVDEMRNFQLDSIRRREDYASMYDKKHPIKAMNEKRPGDQPGFNFSPIGYFSRSEKQKRRLKQRLEREEEQAYIDTKFPRFRVALITGLTGDSLQKFLIHFTPSYSYCRSASSQDILLYINDKLKLFRAARRPR